MVTKGNIEHVFRLLVIEDDTTRIEAFRNWLPKETKTVLASSAGRALGILERDKGRVYAGILMDHDLEKQAVLESDRAFTGTHIANVIIRNISTDVAILVHSMNFSEARIMTVKLESAGFWVTRIPMRELTKMRLLEWLGDVREIWEELLKED